MLDKELSGGQSHDDFLSLVEKYTGTPLNINSASKSSALQSFNGGDLKRLFHSPALTEMIGTIDNEERRVYFHSLHTAMRGLRFFLLPNSNFSPVRPSSIKKIGQDAHKKMVSHQRSREIQGSSASTLPKIRSGPSCSFFVWRGPARKQSSRRAHDLRELW